MPLCQQQNRYDKKIMCLMQGWKLGEFNICLDQECIRVGGLVGMYVSNGRRYSRRGVGGWNQEVYV